MNYSKPFLLFLIMALSVLYGCEEKRIKISQDFSLMESSGDAVEIRPLFSDKLTVTAKVSSWDKLSTEQLRILNELHEDYNRRNVAFLAFYYDGDPEESGKLDMEKKSEGYHFPCFSADSQAVEILGNEEILPVIMLVDGNMTVQRKIFGFVGKEQLEQNIADILESIEKPNKD